MIGSKEEQDYIILYKMAKLGFSPNEATEMDLDIVQAFVYLYDLEKKQYWETLVKITNKVFGGK